MTSLERFKLVHRIVYMSLFNDVKNVDSICGEQGVHCSGSSYEVYVASVIARNFGRLVTSGKIHH